MRNNAIMIAIAIGVLPFASPVLAQTQVQTPLTAQAQAQPQSQAQPQYETVARRPVMEQPVEAPVTRIGDSTVAWLAMQREGRLAAPAQPMLGVEADAAFRRYLKSFDHPIPAQLNSSVGEVGAGSGGGAQN
ncbi:hypothetical protein PAMC26510_27290 [Caballeronia sordidicola]|jgi:hypothetical protein|uniref:DUF3613 domain-containing protein n=2 Tax=Caballeronia sordidicola TaxID=196367 RepID=A0A242MD46_CABSO|nr:hypothetical protein PAMC26510_27290 [Caballeronia sordidicola]